MDIQMHILPECWKEYFCIGYLYSPHYNTPDTKDTKMPPPILQMRNQGKETKWLLTSCSKPVLEQGNESFKSLSASTKTTRPSSLLCALSCQFLFMVIHKYWSNNNLQENVPVQYPKLQKSIWSQPMFQDWMQLM